MPSTSPSSVSPSSVSRSSARPSPAPVPLGPSRTALVVHGALRREIRLAGPLVRQAATGDRSRAKTVADHLDLVLRMLHHHHETEDDQVWPPLVERTGDGEAALLALMVEQHEELALLIERVEVLLPAWADAPTAQAGDALAEVLEDLHRSLVEHLDIEERELLAMADRLLTEEEWEEIARRGESGFEGREKLLVFGILACEADPEILADMLASAPLPVRALLPRLARRAYRRHAVVVHGTSTP